MDIFLNKFSCNFGVRFGRKKDSVELADPRAELDDAGMRKAAGKNKEASIELHFVGDTEGTASDVDGTGGRDAPAAGVPIVYSIKRAGSELRAVTAEILKCLLHSVKNLARTASKRITLMLQTQPLAIRPS